MADAFKLGYEYGWGNGYDAGHDAGLESGIALGYSSAWAEANQQISEPCKQLELAHREIDNGSKATSPWIKEVIEVIREGEKIGGVGQAINEVLKEGAPYVPVALAILAML